MFPLIRTYSSANSSQSLSPLAMILLCGIFSVFAAKGEREYKLDQIFFNQWFPFMYKRFPIKAHQSKSAQLGIKANHFDHFSIRKGTSSFYCLRDEIHLSVNIFSFGIAEHYFKVISIFPIQQGRKRLIENGKVYIYCVINFDFRVLIHGWGSDRESSFNVGTTAAYLENNDFNVIMLDDEVVDDARN